MLELNKEVVKEVYKYANFLASVKYREPLQTLQSRHLGYEKEDFVQDTMKLILKSFEENKTFSNIGKLKKFVDMTMSFHYLKEKRKYFYTKQRGSATCVSLEAPSHIEQMTIGDFVPSKEQYEDTYFDLHHLQSQKLLALYDWSTCTICKPNELKRQKYGYILSVNHFIQIQRELPMRDVCRYYKDRGFHMTRNVFEQISQAIIDYTKKHNLLAI